jgi:DNA replication protein DnaC
MKPRRSSPTKPAGPALRRKILEDFGALGIPLLPEQLDAAVGRAEGEGLSHREFLRARIGAQADGRRDRRIARRIRAAPVAEERTRADFDWQFNAAVIDRVPIAALARGEFLGRRPNLVWVGPSGVGKSPLIPAIGRSACARDDRVRYETSASVLQELTAALADQALERRLRSSGGFDRVILDEFGFDRVERLESPPAASLLSKLIHARSGRSTALVTTIDFESWGEYLGAPPRAMAFLDRVVDGAIILKTKGGSYRAHRAERAAAGPGSKK